MRLTRHLKTTLLLGSLLAFCAGVQAESDGDPALGQELYEEFCSNCHGANKAGLSQFSDDEAMFSERLEGVTENMPDFAGVFEDDEVAALFAYLSETANEE